MRVVAQCKDIDLEGVWQVLKESFLSVFDVGTKALELTFRNQYAM